ncbi:MAG: hypothetical protein LBC88_00145, partial [Spirochaetaceae bacterium]|nr:hypothetical protein [Spirochaetaceae bacterium]
GIFVKFGTVTMNSGTISGNSGAGGGVFVCDTPGTFTMSGGTITGNSAGSGANPGGGVRIGGSGTFIMDGGVITANSAGYGGGVGVDYLSGNGGTFIKRGGTIYGNNAGADSNNADASGNGHAVFAGRTDIPSPANNKYRDTTAGTGIRMYYYNGGMNDPGSLPDFPAVNTSGQWLP